MNRARARVPHLVLVACLGLAGCSAASGWTGGGLPDTPTPGALASGTAPAATGTPGATPSASPTPTTPRGLCASALPDRTLLGWAAATVGDFRAYSYGTQNRRVPLAKAFPGADDDVTGAWCATRSAKQATAWWAVVYDRRPRWAITVVGPGEGKHLGKTSGPPAVP